MILAEYWCGREPERAVAVLRTYAARFGRDGLPAVAVPVVERAIGKKFTPSPSFSPSGHFGATVRPQGATLVQYRLLALDESFVRESFRAGKPDLRGGPDGRIREVARWTHRFDAGRPQEQAIGGGIVAPAYGVFEEEIDGFAVRWPAIRRTCAMIVKVGRGGLFVFVARLDTGEPVRDVTLEYFGPEKRTAVTDAAGCARMPRAGAGWIVGLAGGESLYCDVGGPEEESPDVIDVRTDRPLYRGGQTVHFRAIVRPKRGGSLAVEILDPDRRRVYRRELPVSEFGTLNGSFDLADEPPLGSYTIVVRDEHTRTDEWSWPRPKHGCRFKVAAYRKPEMKVEIRASGTVAPGGKGRAVVEARYLFGTPAAGAKVEWKVQTRSCYPDASREEPGLPEDHPYSWYVERSAAWWWQETEVARGEGATDAEGRLPIEFPAEIEERDAVYVVEAEVTDDSRRPAQGRCGIPVPVGEVRLRIVFGSSFHRAGQRVPVTVVATDFEKRPARGRRIELAAFRQGGEEFEQFHQAQGETDATGAARFEVTVESPGLVRFRAKSGRAVRRDHLWTAGEEIAGTEDAANVSLSALTEKYVYRSGDRASLFVRSTQKNMPVLVTLEADRVLHAQIVRMSKRGAIVEIPLPEDAPPTVIVKVHAWRGGAAAGAGVRLLVVPRDKWLEVSVAADRDAYRPLEKAKVRLDVRDGRGRPVETEVALGIVDEAIHLLEPDRSPDLRKVFQAEGGSVITDGWGPIYDDWFDPFQQSSGGGVPLTGATFSLEEGPPARVAAFAPTETRRWFPDTLRWVPSVRTGADGHAELEVEVADSLTTWNLTAHAVGRGDQVGWGRSRTLVRKNVIARLVAPRFVTQGDEVSIAIVIHNDLETKETFAISLEAKGATGGGEVRETIDARGSKRVEWKVRADRLGSLVLTAKAMGARESDAMELEIPVRTHGLARYEYRAGRVDGVAVEKISIPKDAVDPEILISVTPGPLAAVTDALPYLAGYPYGCVEQTMSRFLPSLHAHRALRALGLRNEKLEAELPRMIEAGLQRLYRFQHSDGGWGWWERDGTNRFMTAYVVAGLSQAKAAGVAMDEGVLRRGTECLRRMLEEAPDPYLLWAYAHESAIPDGVVGKMPETVRAKLLTASALRRRGQVREAAALLQGVESAGIEDTALHLSALVAVGPADPRIPALLQRLLSMRNGSAWISTRDSAFAVYALTDYLVATRELDPGQTAVVRVNGVEVYRGPGTRDIRIRDLKPENEVRIESAKRGLFYSIARRTFETAEPLRPSAGAIVVARKYERVVSDGDKPVFEPMESGARVRPGYFFTPQTRRVLSLNPVRRIFPSGLKAIGPIEACPASFPTSAPVEGSQIRIVASPEAETRKRPSGLKASPRTLPAWALSVCRCLPSGMLQIRTVLSSEPLASSFPSGLNASAAAASVWPLNVWAATQPA